MSQPFNVNNPVGRKRTHTPVAKSRARSSRCCGLSSVVYHRGSCVRKLFTGLIMYYPLKIKNSVLYCIVLYF